MYSKTLASTGSAGVVAFGGLNTAWTVLAAVMLVFAVVAVMKLIPKQGKAG